MANEPEIRQERKRAAKIRRLAVSNSVAGPVCYACRFSYPYIIQAHHIIPIAEAQTISEQTVNLCPTCHAMVHEIRRLHFAEHRLRVRFRADRLEQLDYWEEQQDRAVVQRLYEIAKAGIV